MIVWASCISCGVAGFAPADGIRDAATT